MSNTVTSPHPNSIKMKVGNMIDINTLKDEREKLQIGHGKRSFMLNFIPSGFDIETYTQYQKDENGIVTSHYTNMYIAMFQIGSQYVECRTWSEVSEVLKDIENVCCMGEKRFLMFIHNQDFEFSFAGTELTKLGHDVQVFARKKRKPMRIDIDEKIIILDSCKITGFSLAKLAENYTTTQKAKGDLDYSIPRNRYTKLSDVERGYCHNDVLILKEFAEYYRDKYLSIGQMPMTQTMVANQFMKDIIKDEKATQDVYYLMQKIYPKTQRQYDYIMLFFAGAYTHGMLRNLFTTLSDGLAFDMQSQYPYVCMSKYFPMGKFHNLHDMTKVENFIKTKCCLLDVTFTNIQTKYGVTILSKHKLVDVESATWDNGRLYRAKSCRAFITEVDLSYLKIHYDFEITYNACTYAERGSLPRYFRLTVAELYSKKSELKGIEGKEIEYMESKQKLNGESYGAVVTRINTTENVFVDGQWIERPNESIDFSTMWKRKDKAPQWGIYITAWARYMILSAVAEVCKIDASLYWYSDTDSCKTKNDIRVLNLMNEKNKQIISDNQKFIDELGLKKLYPNTDFSTMGIFDREDDLIYFKSLGSKKYMATTKKGTSTTVAGLPKGKYVPYADNLWHKEHGIGAPSLQDIYDSFELGKVFLSTAETSKLCAYYEDNEKTFDVTDTQGNTETITTSSYVSLIPTSFSMKENADLAELYYTEYLLKILDSR